MGTRKAWGLRAEAWGVRIGAWGLGWRLRLGFVALLMVGAAAVAQPVVYVDADGVGANTGASWADALTDLQAALDLAEASDGAVTEIWVAEGTYKPSKRTDPEEPRSATFSLIDGVSLYGGFAGGESSIEERDIDANPTVLSGDFNGDDLAGFTNYDENAMHVVTVSDLGDGQALDGLTVTSGFAHSNGFFESRGGGMVMEDSLVDLRNCTFTLNFAKDDRRQVATSPGGGAAVFMLRSDRFEGSRRNWIVSESRFIDNRVDGGGGTVEFYGDIFGRLIFSNCRFEQNHGAFGAIFGLVSSGGSLEFHGCYFKDNTAGAAGGAISLFGSGDTSLDISASTFVGNQSGSGPGGAVDFSGVRLQIEDTIFEDNTTGYSGGAINAEVYDHGEIVNCRFERNTARYGGGGVYAYGVSVRGSQFIDNASGFAGGLESGSNEVTIERCSFFGNYGGYGGGGLSLDGGTVAQCEFVENSAWNGGALYVGGTTPHVVDSRFIQNSGDLGGAVFVSGGRLLVERSHMVQNRATIGGAVNATEFGPDLSIVNSLLAENDADVYGGGIAGGSGTVDVRNSTIANNESGALGAGMIVSRDTSVSDSIVWGNVLDPSGGAWRDASAQVEGIEDITLFYSDVEGWTELIGGEGNLAADPMFVAPEDPDGWYGPLLPDYHLRADSPCINTGLHETVDWGPWYVPPPELDLDGKPRVLCQHVDIGAYEFGVAGDVDCDFDYDLSDFAVWDECGFFGPGAPGHCPEVDADGDGDLDLRDLSILLPGFGAE